MVGRSLPWKYRMPQAGPSIRCNRHHQTITQRCTYVAAFIHPSGTAGWRRDNSFSRTEGETRSLPQGRGLAPVAIFHREAGFMNPIFFAMKHPITTLMLVVGLIAGGVLALNRMRVDIFPPLNEPRVYVFLQFGGMSPGQMEGLIVNQFELNFQYVDGVQQIESSSIQQCALIKLSFFPGTDMGAAQAEVVAMANRAMARMPPGTLPPMIMRMDEGSVPVGYLVLESEKTSLGMMADYAQNIVRPLVQANVPGTVAVSPFGANVRTILVNVDPDRLQTYNLSPQDVVNALMDGNVVT